MPMGSYANSKLAETLRMRGFMQLLCPRDLCEPPFQALPIHDLIIMPCARRTQRARPYVGLYPSGGYCTIDIEHASIVTLLSCDLGLRGLDPLAPTGLKYTFNLSTPFIDARLA